MSTGTITVVIDLAQGIAEFGEQLRRVEVALERFEARRRGRQTWVVTGHDGVSRLRVGKRR